MTGGAHKDRRSIIPYQNCQRESPKNSWLFRWQISLVLPLAVSPSPSPPLPALHLVETPPREKREKMEATSTATNFNVEARREAVVLTGFPLVALAFQTLGMFSFIPTTCSHELCRDHLFRYRHRQHRPLHKASRSADFCSSLLSTCSMVSGQRRDHPHPLRMSLVVSARLCGLFPYCLSSNTSV
jgi:hypothetical protein